VCAGGGEQGGRALNPLGGVNKIRTHKTGVSSGIKYCDLVQCHKHFSGGVYKSPARRGHTMQSASGTGITLEKFHNKGSRLKQR